MPDYDTDLVLMTLSPIERAIYEEFNTVDHQVKDKMLVCSHPQDGTSWFNDWNYYSLESVATEALHIKQRTLTYARETKQNDQARLDAFRRQLARCEVEVKAGRGEQNADMAAIVCIVRSARTHHLI